ncbi:hypothetical protein U9M48_037719 [Paspalum notatum var. saurae]|uniref:Uncharacterized protein n=1 Tax=Paspalum notatum var. saurae TaxID=547442 RepID=A0AAQ3UJY2_PASNO
MGRYKLPRASHNNLESFRATTSRLGVLHSKSNKSKSWNNDLPQEPQRSQAREESMKEEHKLGIFTLFLSPKNHKSMSKHKGKEVGN